MGARKLQGRSSERRNQECAPEGSEILKAKKDSLAAVRLLRFKHVPGGMSLWMDHWREMKAKEAAGTTAEAASQKRKKVAKQRVPKEAIDHMVARPFRSIEDLSPAQLAKRSREFRQLYALTTFIDGKLRDYEQALIRQYDTQGYAEDETEVTDSEEEDATVVEN